MKYRKATAPFPLEKGMKTLVTTFTQVHGQKAQKVNTSHALMINALQSDKMVLKEHAKCLLPILTAGAILPRKHEINLANIAVIDLHPDYWDEYLKKGLIDEEGNFVTKQEATKKVEVVVEVPVGENDGQGFVAETHEEAPIIAEVPATETSADLTLGGEAPATEPALEIGEENDQSEFAKSENAPEEQAGEENATTDPA